MIDELLKELKEKAQELSNNHWGDDERHLIGKGIQCMYVQAENIIRSKLKIGGWIPCSERLPEIEQTVLLSLRSLDVSVGFRANTDGYFYTEGEGYVLYENVLAWQPLLEAYHE